MCFVNWIGSVPPCHELLSPIIYFSLFLFYFISILSYILSFLFSILFSSLIFSVSEYALQHAYIHIIYAPIMHYIALCLCYHHAPFISISFHVCLFYYVPYAPGRFSTIFTILFPMLFNYFVLLSDLQVTRSFNDRRARTELTPLLDASSKS